MSKNNFNFILTFLVGAFCGITLFYYYQSNRKKRIDALKNKINNGFDQDRLSLQSDYMNIYNNISKL